MSLIRRFDVQLLMGKSGMETNMNVKKPYHVILLLSALFFVSGCTEKRSEQTPAIKQDGAIVKNPVATQPVSSDVLLDARATVKGYQTRKYLIKPEIDGVYTFSVSSENPGVIFVLQDSEGNDVINESFPTWTGELKKGEYRLIVGLTRNAARKNMEKEVGFSILVKRNKQV